ALAEARAAGSGETRRFDAGTEVAMRTRMRLTSELQQAIEDGDLRLHFQPKVDLATGAIVGAEALARWEHRLFGIQPPSRFIPVAEQSGLIAELGEWVLRRSARFAAALNQGRATPLPISVNVSPLQFRRGDLVRALERISLESGIRPQWLTLELTETVLAESSPERLATLQRLRDAGFGISIDDFGTGYSSLAYLRSFPVSEIKIDRSFVSQFGATRYNRAIIEAVLKIGASLDAAVCAEGIETEAERQRLLEMGCRLGQGYLFSRPVEERALLELLRRREAASQHAA
ncbi:MAG TPA: EAL domain-containing protein, partial [Acetobacteraceae bacterium]|nr:EAL domain-containing protein [Acetobacteraceae bacterium]